MGFDHIFWSAISGEYWFGFENVMDWNILNRKTEGQQLFCLFVAFIYLEVCLDLKEEDLIAPGKCCIKYQFAVQISLGALIEAKKSGQSGGM